MIEIDNETTKLLDFGQVHDTTKNIIKVVGVGGGGCNAVGNMYMEHMDSVTFAVCNTDSKSLSVNPVPTKIMLGDNGHGAGADPKKGREEAEKNINDIRRLFSDGTKMAFIVAAMGGGTGTGAGPLVAGMAKESGMLTIGIVTLPFYFEKRPKIVKALKGLDEMRRNVDALLIINNEQISKVYSDTHVPVEEAMKRADNVMANAVRSISELITLNGKIQTDFADVKTTMTNGGGAIMSIGRAAGEHRVQNAVLNALNSPLLYGSDISKATRILFNIYTSSDHPIYVDELEEIDAFMDELDPNIEVIWGIATDDTLGEDAKITILATGFDNSLPIETQKTDSDEELLAIIDKLYGKSRKCRRPTIDNNNADEMGRQSGVDNMNADTTLDGGQDILTDAGVSAASDEQGEENDVNEIAQIDPAKSFYQRVVARIKKGFDIILSDEDA